MTQFHSRESLRVVALGHVDHGKSTVIGHLLADTGALPQGKLESVRLFCERNSKPFEYAFLLDTLKDERSQGITIDSAKIFFKTEKRDYILIDAPGHVEFIKNMVSGAAQADAALLVIDAREGVRANSRRHATLLSMLGINQFAVLVNKMDLVGFSQEAFESIVDEYRPFLDSIGLNCGSFIPVSGYEGDNLAASSCRMPWYRGATILSALDSFISQTRPLTRPFRMPVQDVYKFTKGGDNRRIVVGTVEAGAASAGDEVIFYPSGKFGTISSIENFPVSSKPRAEAGTAAGFTLTEPIYVKRGEVAALRRDPAPQVAQRLRARLFWLGREPFVHGKDYVFKLGAARVQARLESAHRVIDASSLEVLAGRREVGRDEVAECTLALSGEVAMELAKDEPGLGRFVLIDDFEISGGGIVEEILADERSSLREKVRLRNAKWQKSTVPREARRERYGQKAALVLITGTRSSRRKEIARALELRLFEEGRFVYFLGIGSVLYGVDADIQDHSQGHAEDIRRLAEIAHIILDCGQILIVSAAELTAEDLSLIETAIEPERIETVWVGEEVPERARFGIYLKYENASSGAAAIKLKLEQRGFLKA